MPSSLALTVLLSGGESSSVIDLDATLFVQMGVFFCAFFILKFLVFKPVMEVFDARERATEGATQDAHRMEAEAAEKRTHFEGELRKVSAAAGEERDKQRGEAQKLARELTEQARQQAQQIQKAAKERLDTDAAVTRARTLAEVPTLARQIAEKLLGRSMS
jgi:F-type H+-transporting ATPase subunit b